MANNEPSWLRVHRAVRALPDGEGPFHGLLVADGDATVVAVPVTELEGWEGWPYAGATHIAAPRDIALLDSGFHALLPWCTMKVTALLADRALADDSLSSGEAGTLVISVLRGMAELGDAVGHAHGCWWLTSDGRPVLVPGEGAEVGEGARALFRDLARSHKDRRLSRLLAQLHDAAEHPRTLVREIARWESELLECAAPQALRVEVYAPSAPHPRGGEQRVRGSLNGAVAAMRAHREDDVEWRHELTVAERFRELLDRVRVPKWIARHRSSEWEERRRPRTLVVAAVVAGVVLLGGMLWPTSSDKGGSATAPIAADPAEALTPTSESEHETPRSPSISEPLMAFAHIVEQAQRCLALGDDQCAAVLLDSSEVTASLLIGLLSAAPEISLADDFGDIAVVRLANEEHREYVVVLSQHEQKWFVRDVYDLGQP